MKPVNIHCIMHRCSTCSQLHVIVLTDWQQGAEPTIITAQAGEDEQALEKRVKAMISELVREGGYLVIDLDAPAAGSA